MEELGLLRIIWGFDKIQIILRIKIYGRSNKKWIERKKGQGLES